MQTCHVLPIASIMDIRRRKQETNDEIGHRNEQPYEEMTFECNMIYSAKSEGEHGRNYRPRNAVVLRPCRKQHKDYPTHIPLLATLCEIPPYRHDAP